MSRAGPLVAAVWLAGCAAGCVGLPPKPAQLDLPTEAPLRDEGTGGGAWPGTMWWTEYHDATLDRLIELGLASAPSLKTAHARFDTARQSVRIAGAAAGAQVQANGDAARQRLSDNGLFPPRLLGFHWYNEYDLGLQASYTFDWWGKQRDAVEAAIDEAHAAQADRSAASLVVASAIAETYFGWQADQSRLALELEREATVLRDVRIAGERVKAELDPADQVQRAAGALAAVREQIAALDGSVSLRVIALAALIGRPAGDLPDLHARPLPTVSGNLPDSVRIDLIARRADLSASRWRIEAAEKNRAAARAEFFPDVSINALIGLQSVDIGKLLQYNSRVPLASAAIHLPIFDAGRLQARYGASQAALDAAVASYQDTLVTAAREVATQAAARAQTAAERTQRLIAVRASEVLRDSAAARVRQGVSDMRAELTATETWIEQRDALIQLDAAALSADIGLQRALGGGYGTNEASR